MNRMVQENSSGRNIRLSEDTYDWIVQKAKKDDRTIGKTADRIIRKFKQEEETNDNNKD
jgi:hypothetical protein